MSKFVTAKQFFKGFSKAFEGPQHGGKVATIGGVKPNVAKTKKEKVLRDLKITKQKVKGVTAKLKQIQFERANPQKRFSTGKELEQQEYFNKGKGREKKMGGGMMGRRFGMKSGTPFKKKTNVEKIKETFGVKKKDNKQRMQAKNGSKKKFPDLTGDGKVTFADILKGRGVINGKKKKKA